MRVTVPLSHAIPAADGDLSTQRRQHVSHSPPQPRAAARDVRRLPPQCTVRQHPRRHRRTVVLRRLAQRTDGQSARVEEDKTSEELHFSTSHTHLATAWAQICTCAVAVLATQTISLVVFIAGVGTQFFCHYLFTDRLRLHWVSALKARDYPNTASTRRAGHRVRHDCTNGGVQAKGRPNSAVKYGSIMEDGLGVHK